MKAVINLTWAKGQLQEAQEALDAINAMGIPAKLTEGVHPQTLQAWAREQMEEGNISPDDLEVLGLYNRRFVAIK